MRNKTEVRSVFLSYAREDEDLVLPVAHLLRAAGTLVFVDQEDIPYGDDWESTLLGKLRGSERILVFWSADAARSKWVRREYQTAIGAGLRVVPVPLDATPLSTELSTFQALNSLVPLVYKLRRRQALRRLWEGGPEGMSRARLILVLILSVSATVASYVAWSEAAQGPESTLLEGTILWILSAAGVILMIKILARSLLSPWRLRRDLEGEIYYTIFDSMDGPGRQK